MEQKKHLCICCNRRKETWSFKYGLNYKVCKSCYGVLFNSAKHDIIRFRKKWKEKAIMNTDVLDPEENINNCST